jgi:DNA phosphorothioation system restriction enzyme
MRSSVRYWRAVGYFSSHALAAAADGLPEFIARNGSMRLVASPDLSDEDVAAIQRGYEAREDIVERVLIRVLQTDQPDPVRERLGYLAWLVAQERLDIKIALVDSGEPGIYHEKIGVFVDAEGNYVAFEGSANESRGGLVANFESILAFRSNLRGQAEIARGIRDDFERLWEDETPRLTVMEFSDAAKRELLTRYKPDRPPAPPSKRIVEPDAEPIADGNPTEPELPAAKPLRDYQKDALAAWFRNQGRGLFQMATGTGKTVTALSLATKLFDASRAQDQALVIVVLCPFQHLVSQWGEEARRFGMNPVLCFRSRASWFDDLAARLDECRRGHRTYALAITTNATFQTDAFQRLAAELPERTLLIADEVHNVGAPALRSLLPSQVRYRLGLSATPERWYDDEGTAALTDYFGGVIYELGLERAIELGALTPYEYFPLVVELHGDELEQYLELSTQIGMRMGGGDGEEDPILEALLIKRARILSVAEGKLGALQRAVQPLRDTTHNLFYCGDGQVEYAPAGETIRQLDAVVHLLGRGVGMAVNSYTAETYLDERDELRQQFANGDLQGLVAIRCLDEGVDIPETERAFILASSTNPKQFIQRRGRVLRLYPGKTKASIFDFVTIPPADAIDSANFGVERRLVRRELERVALFARLALNGPAALAELESLRKQYNLLHIA